jgi:iron complex outermembrane receptor protein
MVKQVPILAVLSFLLIFSLPGWAQTVNVTGNVRSALDNEPLPGVGVQIKGTTRGAITDIDGNFKLEAENGNVLVISFLGYKTVEITVGPGANYNVLLQEDVKELGDVVVIGYGTAKKKDLTGSVTSISTKDFQNGVITTPDQLISGKAAGVQITPNGGGPGAGSTIRIRGNASLSASNDPLIVIDGVPVDNRGIAGSPNPLSLINPNDIENISILKDASAAAIYGSRASNGVILITTKKGARGAKPTLTISSQNSISVIPRYVDVLSAAEVRKLVKDSGTVAQQALITDSTTSTDWQREIFQLARTFDQNISYSGELFKTPFRISAGYLNQTGILKTDLMNRVSNAINISPTFFDGSVKVNLNLKNSYSSNRFANGGAIGSALVYDPTKPVYARGEDANRFGGFYEITTDGIPTSLAPRNPVGMLYMTRNISNVYRSVGNLTIDYIPSFFPDLTANLNLGYDVSRGSGFVETSPVSAMAFEQGGSYNQYKQHNSNQIAEFFLRYNKESEDKKHRVEVLGLTSYQDVLTTNFFYRGLNYFRDTIQGTTPLLFDKDKPQWRIASLLSRANYSYMSKYFITATVRRDGSSRFGRNNRWGTFPSAAVAWTLSEEAFLKDNNTISLLKFRLGYGSTGQQDIGQNYAYLPRYSIGVPSVQYPFGGQFYTMISPIAYDPNIQWETSIFTNLAVDFGILKDRINGSIDFYRKSTKDLLNVIPIPSGSNFSDQVFTNVGNMENRGVEITINTIPIQKEDFVWNFNFNVTFNRNEVTKLRPVADSNFIGNLTGGIGLGRTIQIHTVGFPQNSFYVLQQVYDANGKPIEGEFVDQNGDGIINEKDFIKMKDPWPNTFFGISTDFTYKNFTFGMVWRGSLGNYVFANQQATSGTIQSVINNNPFITNGSGDIRETRFSGNLPDGAKNNNRFFSSYYLRDASFIRADNIYMSYNFGEVYGRMRLAANFNLQNPLVITRYKGIDPEIFNGIDNTIYPRPRVFTAGVTLNY